MAVKWHMEFYTQKGEVVYFGKRNGRVNVDIVLHFERVCMDRGTRVSMCIDLSCDRSVAGVV